MEIDKERNHLYLWYNTHRFCCLGERNEERYYEFLNILMTRHIPVRNLHFFLTFLIEFLFTSVVLIVSIFTKNQMHNLSIFLIHITIVHLVIVLLAFLLFQKYSASKLLQSMPTTSYLFLHFEFLFLSSIFFEEQYLLIFFLFIGLSIAFQVVNFFYQISIVSIVKQLPDNEDKKNMLHLPTLIVTITSAAIVVITRLFKLSGIYIIIGLVGMSISWNSFFILGYTQVFTGWRKKCTNNIIFRGEKDERKVL